MYQKFNRPETIPTPGRFDQGLAKSAERSEQIQQPFQSQIPESMQPAPQKKRKYEDEIPQEQQNRDFNHFLKIMNHINAGSAIQQKERI
jgi:hypothetical protein